MSDGKSVPAPDPRSAVAGPTTKLDNRNPDQGMPAVNAPGLGYSLPARNDGMIYARPFLCTSVDSRNQHVNGYVSFEPTDRVPQPESPATCVFVGPYCAFVSNIPMGNPSQPNTVHWLAYNYTGRSDGPGLVPLGSTETVAEVPADPPPVSNANVAPGAEQFDAADRNKDGEVSSSEQRRFDRRHPHEKP